MIEKDINPAVEGEENDFVADLVTLVDEDGVEHEFEIADMLELDDNSYMALIPVLDGADELLDDSGELVVLKVVSSDGEEEYLEAIEDEEEFDRISAIFMERLEEEYDFEAEDEEEEDAEQE